MSEETSTFAKTRRVLQKLILGTRRPPVFLRILSIIAMTWDILLILLFVVLALFSLLGEDVLMAYKLEKFLESTRFLFTYAHLHLFSFLGVVLMWRRKMFGFYLYAFMNLLMPIITYLMLDDTPFPVESLIFSGVMIGLFALNIGVLKDKESRLSDENTPTT